MLSSNSEFEDEASLVAAADEDNWMTESNDPDAPVVAPSWTEDRSQVRRGAYLDASFPR